MIVLFNWLALNFSTPFWRHFCICRKYVKVSSSLLLYDLAKGIGLLLFFKAIHHLHFFTFVSTVCLSMIFLFEISELLSRPILVRNNLSLEAKQEKAANSWPRFNGYGAASLLA